VENSLNNKAGPCALSRFRFLFRSFDVKNFGVRKNSWEMDLFNDVFVGKCPESLVAISKYK